jgi:hypothetical protein
MQWSKLAIMLMHGLGQVWAAAAVASTMWSLANAAAMK